MVNPESLAFFEDSDIIPVIAPIGFGENRETYNKLTIVSFREPLSSIKNNPIDASVYGYYMTSLSSFDYNSNMDKNSTLRIKVKNEQ